MSHPARSASRRRGPVILLLAAALVTVLAACGSDADSNDAATNRADGRAAAANELPSTLELEASDYSFTANTDAVAAGPVTVRLTNTGQEAHQVQIGRVSGDLTADDFVRVFHEQGEAAAFGLLEWTGGVNGVEPGETQVATAVFEPGNYLMVCFIPDLEGKSHVAHNMVVPLQVAGRSDATPPPADDVITLTDYAVNLPQGFTGQGTFEVRNEGQENHEMILFRIEDGKTLADVTAWSAGGMKGPAPYDLTGGAPTIPPGATSWVNLDLRPGNYVALCVITSPTTMQQHVQMGMVTPFTIT